MINAELSDIGSRRIIKTYAWPIYSGQGAISATGDDYDIWQTVWNPQLQLLRGKKLKPPMLLDFFTLMEPNIFGNYARFTNKSGRYFSNPFLSSALKEAGGATVATSGDADAVTKFGEYIIDHYTGMAILRTVQSTAVWATAISNANALSAEGFDDWHLWSRAEVEPLRYTVNAVTSGNNQPIGWFPFFRTSGTNYWTSTTAFNASTFAYFFSGTNGAVTLNAKSGSMQFFVVRKHF